MQTLTLEATPVKKSRTRKKLRAEEIQRLRTCSAPGPLLALWHPAALDVLLGDGGAVATASTMGWVRTWVCATAEVLASILRSFTRSSA